MSRFLVLATGGAGGDLQPLIAASLALRGRGHEAIFVGDRSAERILAGLELDVRVGQGGGGERLSSRLRNPSARRGHLALRGGGREGDGATLPVGGRQQHL